MQRNYILGDLWKTPKIYHQFGALWTLSPKKPTLDRRKFTADAFNDCNLSIAETFILNLCIEQNVFLSEFQKAKVIPLPKTRHLKNQNDYRPITLLSVLYKLLERHVHKHLVTCLETWDLFHPLQSGFRRKYSWTTALARLTDSWLSAVNRSDLSGDVFLT